MPAYDPESSADRVLLAAALVARLQAAGFAEIRDPRSTERIFARSISEKHGMVKVCTSIVGGSVRSTGKDAIRVLGVAPSGKVLTMEGRVNRTGDVAGITERTIERARNVWREVKARPCCDRCGMVTFTSQKGNAVCSALCFAGVSK